MTQPEPTSTALATPEAASRREPPPRDEIPLPQEPEHEDTITATAPTYPYTLTLEPAWTLIPHYPGRNPPQPADQHHHSAAPTNMNLFTSAAVRKTGEGTAAAQLTAIALPRTGLDLRIYIGEITNALAARNLTVLDATIRDDIRTDHTPVALVEFQTKEAEQSGHPTIARQAALLSPDGGFILILTYAAADDAADAEFEHIIAATLFAHNTHSRTTTTDHHSPILSSTSPTMRKLR